MKLVVSKYNNIIEFIKSLYPDENPIPLHRPLFIGNEKKYLCDCIDSTYVSSAGKYVDLFEDKIARFTGAKKAVVTVNGTSALHIALQLCGVKQGDEVITQPLTFVATCNAINYCGANPVFVDVDIDTMGMSPEKLNNFLKNNTKWNSSTNQLINKSTNRPISACVPMHTFGHTCRIDEIVEICSKYNIDVVEDAAESLGSTYKGKHTGLFGKVGVLSFNGNKTITSGGGGAIITNQIELAKKTKHLTTTAKTSHKWEYNHDEVGYNYRMPNINAALGCAQLEKLVEFVDCKRKLADKYNDFFKNMKIEFFTEPKNVRSNYWLNAIILNNKKERNEFLKKTNSKNIMTRPIWKLINKLDMYKNCYCSEITNAEWLEDRVVNIPSSTQCIVGAKRYA